MKMGKRVVGIIGGMGPAATVDLQQRIIRLTPAADDADHLRVLVDNNPQVPSRMAALVDGDGQSPEPCLVAMAKGLVDAGAELLVMPCNTAHHYHDAVASAVDVPFINMVEVVGDTMTRRYPGASRLGLLASTAVQVVDLYGPALRRRGIEVLFPASDAQAGVMGVIRAVKAGSVGQDASGLLERAVRELEVRGADLLLVACTELSALGGDIATGLPVLDAAELLAEAVVQRALE